MIRKRSWLAAAVFIAIGYSTATAGEIRLTVKNPSSSLRPNEPVVVLWSMVMRADRAADPQKILLTDDQHRLVPVQIDDLDGDGTPDELTFQASFESRSSRKFFLTTGVADTSRPPAARTDAADYKRIDGVLKSITDDDVPGNGRVRKAYRFDGVGWESEIIAYRLYLDERNAIDLLGKRKPGLYWNYIGTSGVDYQQDADWGTDVLHIGDALGVGGIGFWVADSVQKPQVLDRQRTRIIARGPIRAVVRVEYEGWKVGSRKVNVTSLFTIYAGDRLSEQRVTVSPVSPGLVLATGVVHHDSTETLWNSREGWLCTTGRQARFDDSLMFGISVDPKSIIRKTRDARNELLLLRPDRRAPLKIMLAASWKGESGRMWTREEIQKCFQAASLRLREPLVLHVGTPATGPR